MWRSRRKRVARARRPPCTVLATVLGSRRPRIRLATRDPRAPRGAPRRGLASLLLVESPPRAGYPLDDAICATARLGAAGAPHPLDQPRLCRIRALRRCSQLTAIISTTEIAISIVA